ncbi:B12-binding domain-containing radical SAM protein [Methylomarinum vadi]|uniref:B12-binding domain-containing radical SAM protein n=1 Tax=Methylomarinum vadi TaxID=438855 RepID=UPI0004DF47EA|nr:radical SAM protein [Methylomarinum vadi]
MKPKVLLLTPPMTQLNTPYPATAYLTGFLRKQGYPVAQRDLAIELLLEILSKQGLERIYRIVEDNFAAVDDEELPDSIYHFFTHFPLYQQRVESCIRFLQGKDPSLALRIASRHFLPEGPQFESLYQMEDLSGDVLDHAFGDLGLQDKAKYLATLFINDLVGVMKDGVDPLFEVSRYGERLASSNPSFDDLYRQLKGTKSHTRELIEQLLAGYIEEEQPHVIGITVPFPGNMLGALQIASACRRIDSQLKIVLGGGFVNTELRSLKDPRLFEFVDYVTMDDGERPLLTLLEYLQSQRSVDDLTRTYRLRDGQVYYHHENQQLPDFLHDQTGTPCYEGLPLDRYLSLCEMLNPMHRIWSDGRWNKLTVAHGCYWKKCSFCDISLDYIGRYQEAGAAVIVDRIEQLIAETGQSGFHFVDEAAPPKVLFALAEQLLEREIVITWWGNIRFEKTFTAEKCRLLAESGCIAVSGGLEVASDRLLKLMKKGVSVEQVARVTRHFADAGILVHAYLMYGFPSQTEAETVESLELVRQLMANGCFQSAYWHRFAATVHSPVGLHPEQYRIQLIPNENVQFAENEVAYIDPVGADHDLLGRGLKKALYNYMHGMGFDYPVSFWFDKSVADPAIAPDFIATALTL